MYEIGIYVIFIVLIGLAFGIGHSTGYEKGRTKSEDAINRIADAINNNMGT